MITRRIEFGSAREELQSYFGRRWPLFEGRLLQLAVAADSSIGTCADTAKVPFLAFKIKEEELGSRVRVRCVALRCKAAVMTCTKRLRFPLCGPDTVLGQMLSQSAVFRGQNRDESDLVVD